jgi:hypothetical protein
LIAIQQRQRSKPHCPANCCGAALPPETGEGHIFPGCLKTAAPFFDITKKTAKAVLLVTKM